jgi:hypothetical protein
MADNFEIIRQNVQKMVNAKAPADHINGYLKQKGLTPEQFKARATQQPAPNAPNSPLPRDLASGMLEANEQADPLGFLRLKALDGAPDTLREIPNTPVDRTLGFLGDALDVFPFMGGADEALAGVYAAGAMMPGGRSPSEAFQQELARLEQIRRDQGINSTQRKVATGAGIAASVPFGGAAARFIAKAPTALGRTARAGEVGFGIGGTSGFLGTEGDLGDRAIGGAIGATAGTVLGGAAQPGAELLGFGARKGAETGRAILNTMKNQAQARANPSLQADKLIARALIDDGAYPRPAPMPGQGFVNTGGENLVALGRQATVAPGKGRTIASEFFEEQAAGAPDRAADSLKGLSSKGYYGTVEALDKSREAAAAPLYKAAREKGSAGVWNDHLEELVSRPALSKAWARAQDIAANRGDPLPQIFEMDDAGKIIGIKQIPDLKTWDYIKRGLDDVIVGFKNETTGKIETDAGRGVVALKREMLDELDALIPEYKAARDAWAGPTHSIEMVDLGRDFWKAKGDPADAIRKFKDLSPADQDYVRIGIARNALADVGNTSDAGSVYVKLFNTPNKRALLETAFPDKAAFEKFAAQMQAEKKMLAANRTIQGGSPTSRIDADKAAMSDAENNLGVVEALKSGSIMRLIGEAVQRTKNLQQGVSPEVAESLAQRLFTSNSQAIRQALTAAQNVPLPAPLAALSGGWLRKNPLAVLLGQASGIGGAAIATPQKEVVR